MGFFNPEDCGSYVTCNSDNEGGIRAAKVDCAPTLVFNDELKVCDWPENVPDCALRTVASHPDGVKPSPEPVVACTQEVDGRITGPTPCVEPIIACADGSFRITHAPPHAHTPSHAHPHTDPHPHTPTRTHSHTHPHTH